MAKASIKVETITKMVPTEIDEETFTLKLNRNEAETLYDILRHIGGDPDTTRRGVSNGIQDAISSVLMADPLMGPFRADIEYGNFLRFTKFK